MPKNLQRRPVEAPVAGMAGSGPAEHLGRRLFVESVSSSRGQPRRDIASLLRSSPSPLWARFTSLNWRTSFRPLSGAFSGSWSTSHAKKPAAAPCESTCRGHGRRWASGPSGATSLRQIRKFFPWPDAARHCVTFAGRPVAAMGTIHQFELEDQFSTTQRSVFRQLEHFSCRKTCSGALWKHLSRAWPGVGQRSVCGNVSSWNP